MFDIFYFGKKPNLFEFEQSADSLEQAQRLSRTERLWYIYGGNDYTDFNFDVIPPAWEWNHVYVYGSQWQKNAGVYLVSKWELGPYNFREEQRVHRIADKTNWVVPNNINVEEFDFSWHPDPADSYIHVFGTQWQQSGGPEYHTQNAVQVKYESCQRAVCLPSKQNWKIPDDIDIDTFDFSWHPAKDENYIHVFGTQWQLDGGPEYHTPGAVEKKYEISQKCATTQDLENWIIPNNINKQSFDFSWKPRTDEKFVHIFGTQWQPDGGPEYHTPGAVEKKYETSQKAVAMPGKEYWHIPDNIDTSEFDFSWHPRTDEKFIHIFGTQWQSDGGPEYRTIGASELKYETSQKAIARPVLDNWHVPDYIDLDKFDFSWHPRSDEKFVHVFGTQWHNSGGPEYRTTDATEIKFESAQRAESKPQKDRWEIPEHADIDNFDFSWHPPRGENYVHVFGSQWARDVGPKYVSPGSNDKKYETAQVVKGKITTDIFVIDQFNSNNITSYESVKSQYPDAKKTRGVGNWASIIKKACEASTSDFVWVVSSDYDYTDFDFGWYPETWQSNMIHVFGSKYQKWANVFRVPRWEFLRLAQWFDDIKDFPELNFVQDQTVELFDDNREIWWIDHANNNNFDRDLNYKNVRFFESYLETIKRIIARTDQEYIWITSSVCLYKNFDFKWEPEPWQQDMLHVFSSEDQKFGDTFYVPVEKFKKQLDNIELLDWFNTVNFISNISVPRVTFPTVVYTESSLCDIALSHRYQSPYVWFIHESCQHIDIDYHPSLWREQDRALHVFVESGSVALLPKDVVKHVNDEMYDYPYIKKHSALDEPKMDVIFISNGESLAEGNWKQVQKICSWAKHSNGVDGREKAYKAAAQLSNTDYFYAVFAKTFVFDDFTWNIYPDRLQKSKHYILYSKNQLNGLEYGAMNVNLYNKQLVLDTKPGLDFTLSQKHTVVPKTVSMTIFNEDPWLTWRSSFREVLKLIKEVENGADLEIQHRLHIWETFAEGKNAEWCLAGASDARNFYTSVKGNNNELQKSFDWPWLTSVFEEKYGSIDNPVL